MTYRKWNELYESYKNNFDLELTLTTKGLRYRDLIQKEETKEDVIAF